MQGLLRLCFVATSIARILTSDVDFLLFVEAFTMSACYCPNYDAERGTGGSWVWGWNECTALVVHVNPLMHHSPLPSARLLPHKRREHCSAATNTCCDSFAESGVPLLFSLFLSKNLTLAGFFDERLLLISVRTCNHWDEELVNCSWVNGFAQVYWVSVNRRTLPEGQFCGPPSFGNIQQNPDLQKCYRQDLWSFVQEICLAWRNTKKRIQVHSAIRGHLLLDGAGLWRSEPELWKSMTVISGQKSASLGIAVFFCLNVSFLREGKKLEHFLKLISCAKYQYYTTCMPSPTGSSGLLSWLCWWVCFIPWQIQGLLLQISRRIRGYWESIDFAQVFFLSIPRYRVGKFLQVSTDILVKYESTG